LNDNGYDAKEVRTKFEGELGEMVESGSASEAQEVQ
jgi:hypothetical protein